MDERVRWTEGWMDGNSSTNKINCRYESDLCWSGKREIYWSSCETVLSSRVHEPRPPAALTVCLKPTAVCWGALRSALVRVLRASEYSSWMALIRPAEKHTHSVRSSIHSNRAALTPDTPRHALPGAPGSSSGSSFQLSRRSKGQLS